CRAIPPACAEQCCNTDTSLGPFAAWPILCPGGHRLSPARLMHLSTILYDRKFRDGSTITARNLMTFEKCKRTILIRPTFFKQGRKAVFFGLTSVIVLA